MKKLLLVSALTGVLLSVAGTGFAQQQTAPGAVPERATCSQMAAFCNSSCESVGGPRHRECQTICQTHRVECMASGLWKNPNTGQMTPKRKE
jgi:hypothetical protein